MLAELRRRKVIQVAAIYGVIAWVMTQIGVAIEAPLSLPDWFDTLIIVMLGLGFPIALILAYAFEVTPDGVMRTESADATPHANWPMSARIIGYGSFTGLVALAAIFLYQFNSFSSGETVAVTEDANGNALIDVSAPVPGFSSRAAIAVLPFVNMSGDPSQEYFVDGLTEDIITGLQSIRSFPVIARTSTFTFKDQALDVREIAEILGAGYILEGSVQRAGNRVRITAQLIDAEGVHLWANAYDAEFEDIFAVRDDITNQIVGTIEPELLVREMSRVHEVATGDMEAWDYFLRGYAETSTFAGYVDLNGERVTVERNEAARALVHQALEIDPDFALAYMLLAHIDATYGMGLRSDVSEEFVNEAIARALENARRGRELSPFSASTCSCYSYLLTFTGDAEMALPMQEEAVELNPANSQAHAILAKVYETLGRYDDAIEEIHVAERLSPRDVDMSLYLSIEAAAHLGAGNFEEALAVAQRSIMLTSLNHDAHAIRIAALYALGREADAASALAEMLEFVPAFSTDMLFDSELSDAWDPLLEEFSESAGSVSTYRRMIGAILGRLGWQGV